MATPARDSNPLEGITPIRPRVSAQHAFLFDDLSQAAETLKLQYYHDYEFNLPLPECPVTSFCYLHKGVSEVFDRAPGSERAIPSTVLDAMATGVIDNVSLDYLLLYPEDAKEMREVAEMHEVAYQRQKQMKLDRGEELPPIEDPMVMNPDLTEADAALINVELEDNAMNQREMPTIQLLKRPIYTELGQESRQSRNAARLARISTGGELAAEFSQNDSLRLSSLQSPIAPRGSTAASNPLPRGADEWSQQVNVSFKRAKALDTQFDAFTRAVLTQKLGLTNEKHLPLARQLLSLLRESNKGAKGALWAMVCGAAAKREPEFGLAAMTRFAAEQPSQLSLRQLDQWDDWFQLYTSALKEGAKTTKAPELREQDLAPPANGARGDEFTIGFQSKPEGFTLVHPSRPGAVPLAVLPVLPGKATEAPEAQHDLGESGRTLTHYVFSNTRQNTFRETESTFVPHVVADSKFVLRPNLGISAPAGQKCGTALYEQLPEEFTASRHQAFCRGSYALEIFADRAEYSRIGQLAVQDHAVVPSEARQAAKRNTVVVWLDDDDLDQGAAMPSASSRKRVRDEAGSLLE